MKAKLTAKDARVNAMQLPAVWGYRNMLKYLFHELIENAVKFQPQNQSPEIKISVSEDAINGDKFFRIGLTDNGVGFDPVYNSEIFEMFKRLDPEHFRGSGIGLALCSKIMDLHKGSITAEGRPGKGATISCFFPTGEKVT